MFLDISGCTVGTPSAKIIRTDFLIAQRHLKHKNYVARQKARLAKEIATLG